MCLVVKYHIRYVSKSGFCTNNVCLVTSGGKYRNNLTDCFTLLSLNQGLQTSRTPLIVSCYMLHIECCISNLLMHIHQLHHDMYIAMALNSQIIINIL